MDLLSVRGISIFFGGLAAVYDVSISVSKGEIVGLIGPNGAGKTTILNAITGFIKPAKGEIQFAGENITGWKPHFIVQKGVVRTYQITSLFPKLSVRRNVLVATHSQRRPGLLEALIRSPHFTSEERRAEQRTDEILEFLGLSWKSEVLANNLSYGEQRKLEIAIAMATGPKLLLLDEPAAGMNPAECKDLMGTIGKLKSFGVTILLIEHNMRLVMGVCERVVVINFGEIIASGSPHDVSRHEDVIKAYLGERRQHVASQQPQCELR